jgi:hypothetical protein
MVRSTPAKCSSLRPCHRSSKSWLLRRSYCPARVSSSTISCSRQSSPILAPNSAIEWLLAIDVAELTWEIHRYRILRHKVLEAHRQKAIEAALRRIDLVGIAPDVQRDAECHIVRNPLSWRIDPIAATEIESRLAAYSFDQHSVNMEVYAQAREIFILFEGLLNAAQARRLLLLKEINHQRSFLALKRDISRPGGRVRNGTLAG